jgi:hypothetical protein
MSATRHDEMREQVQRFHGEHPEVWDLFVRFTQDRIASGFSNYAVKAIFERIRWEVDGAGGNARASFKLNNNYPAFYARRFMKIYPKHEGFFRTREQTSSRNAPSGLPELGPADYEEDHDRSRR